MSERIAIVTDTHANLPAFDAALTRIDQLGSGDLLRRRSRRVRTSPERDKDAHDLTRLAEISERRVPSGLVLVARSSPAFSLRYPSTEVRCSATYGGRPATSASCSSFVRSSFGCFIASVPVEGSPLGR